MTAPPCRVAPAESPVWVTPGVKAASEVKLLRATGRLSICVELTAYERSALCVCTRGDWAVTITVSAMAPGSIVTGGMPTRSPPLTMMPPRFTVLNASRVTSTV